MKRAAICFGLTLSTAARADGFFEADLGLATPFADDQYDSDLDTSVKFGVRVGTATKFGGLDLAVDVTPFNNNLSSSLADVSIQRYRFMVGARYLHPLAPKARLFVRAAAGVDIIHYHATGNVFGVSFDNSETDPGIALEVDAGVLFDLGKVTLGAKLGLPIGLHFNKDDPNDPNDADLEYTGADIDFGFVLAVPF